MTKLENSTLTFKADLKLTLPLWLIFLPSVFVIGVLRKQGFISTWPFALGLTLIMSAYSILLMRLNVIHIDPVKQEIKLTKTNLLKKQILKIYPLTSLQFTYRISRVSLYSRELNILTLFINNKQIAKIITDYDGWAGETANDVAKALTNFGVPKKFTEHGFKDAEINGL